MMVAILLNLSCGGHDKKGGGGAPPPAQVEPEENVAETTPDAEQDQESSGDTGACLLSTDCNLPSTLQLSFPTTLNMGDPAMNCTEIKNGSLYNTGVDLRIFWNAKCNSSANRKLYTASLSPSNYGVNGSPQSLIDLGVTNVAWVKTAKLDSNLFVVAYTEMVNSSNFTVRYKLYNSTLVEQASGTIPDGAKYADDFEVIANGTSGFMILRGAESKASVFLYSAAGSATTGEVILPSAYYSSNFGGNLHGISQNRVSLVGDAYLIEIGACGSSYYGYCDYSFSALNTFKLTQTGQVTCQNSVQRNKQEGMRFPFGSDYYRYKYNSSQSPSYTLIKTDLSTLSDASIGIDLSNTVSSQRWIPGNVKQLTPAYVGNLWYPEDGVAYLNLDKFVPASDLLDRNHSPLSFGATGETFGTFDFGMLNSKLYVIYATAPEGLVIKISDKDVPTN